MTPHPCETVRDLQREVAELRAQNAKLASDITAHEHINRQLVADKRRLDALLDLDVRILWPKSKTGWYHFNCRADVDAMIAMLKRRKARRAKA